MPQKPQARAKNKRRLTKRLAAWRAEKLDAEEMGLHVLQTRAPESAQNARASRILLLADDGSTRFYRDCDALLSRYAQRLLACRLQVPGEALGNALLGSPRMVRAV